MRSTDSRPLLYARATGLLLLISIFAGVFGEMFVMSDVVVDGDANATAAKIINSESMFRLGFAAYLVEAICDVVLILLFYLLLSPVEKNLARLTVLFGLVSIITFAFTEMFYISTLVALKADYLKSFTTDQVNSLSMLLVNLYGYGGGVFMLFYGLATLLRGYLIVRSGYIPKFLGILFMIGGSLFVIRNFMLVLKPAYASGLLLIPTLLGMLSLSIWFIIKGVDLEKWKAWER